MQKEKLNMDDISLILLAIFECRRLYTYGAPRLPMLIEGNAYKELNEAAEKLTALEDKIREIGKNLDIT